uniref:Uncharacterized protein n=1 Tax=Talaromyces marneffei PM1 TaxID=1077442 RepID=A0A093UQL1_TALMA
MSQELYHEYWLISWTIPHETQVHRGLTNDSIKCYPVWVSNPREAEKPSYPRRNAIPQKITARRG